MYCLLHPTKQNKMSIENIDFNQMAFIKKEYNLLSVACENSYYNNNFEQLKTDRARLNSFVYTIEGIFNVDFYSEIRDKII